MVVKQQTHVELRWLHREKWEYNMIYFFGYAIDGYLSIYFNILPQS